MNATVIILCLCVTDKEEEYFRTSLSTWRAFIDEFNSLMKKK